MSFRVLVNCAAGIRNVSVATDRPASICRSSPPIRPPAPIASEVSPAAFALTSLTRTVMEPRYTMLRCAVAIGALGLPATAPPATPALASSGFALSWTGARAGAALPAEVRLVAWLHPVNPAVRTTPSESNTAVVRVMRV